MPTNHRPVKVVVDSAADIPQELAQQLDITVIPLRVHIGGKTYLDGVNISGEDFYRELEATRSVTTTSLPALDSLEDAYRRLTRDGFDVVSVHMSSKLSGTYNAALMASTGDDVITDAVAVVDTRTISMSEGWCAIVAAEAARDGKSLEEVTNIAEEAATRAILFGALETLEYVIKSGRVSRLPGTVGTVLSIKPILTTLPNGEAAIIERVRTRKKVLERITELTAALGPLDRIAVMHGADPEGAQQLIELLEAINPPKPIVVGHIGAVLGTHIGPGGVGVCCLKASAR
ncbi:MAG: DegV family protein [Chloroflexota bacterium]